MTNERAIITIEHWVGCDHETAKMIFNGVWPWNGDNYSARVVASGKLEICKDGFPIHLISCM